jgi:hypothetical protein
MTESMTPIELLLPVDLVQRASLRGNEYAWTIDDIPKVIEAARQANLASIGGQLQFRLPDGGTCECYWVQVDTYKSVSTSLPWQEQVDQTAIVALADFSRLLLDFDFVAEGRGAFAEHFNRFVAEGGDPVQTMYFAWYLDDGGSGKWRSSKTQS